MHFLVLQAILVLDVSVVLVPYTALSQPLRSHGLQAPCCCLLCLSRDDFAINPRKVYVFRPLGYEKLECM